MSLRMITDVLSPKPIVSHCPMCGRPFGKYPSDEEHIFPRWLQHRHDLWNKRLNIPNFLEKRYKSVKIRLCTRCNGKVFGAVERRLAPVLGTDDQYEAAKKIPDEMFALWLGKIMWLLTVKSHSALDYRTRNDSEMASILPDEAVSGALYVAMFLRAHVMKKKFLAAHWMFPGGQLLISPVFTVYRFQIDVNDDRFEDFDFNDFSMGLGVAMRTGNLGLVCVFDGGAHGRHRSEWYRFLADEVLNPTQFSEVVARIFYDQTVQDEDSLSVTYLWNKSMNAVLAYGHTFAASDPYLERNHDPRRLAELIGRYTFYNPNDLIGEDGAVITFLVGPDGKFRPVIDKEPELEEARKDPRNRIVGPSNSGWRTREEGPATNK